MKDWLEALRARPEEDAPRLAWAEHLRAEGDPRGDWIALQCARARGEGAELDALRERALWQRFGERWIYEDTGLAPEHFGGLEEVRYERGAPSSATLPLGRALACAEKLARFPLRALRVHALEAEAQLEALAGCGLLRAVRELELGYGVEHLDGEALRRALCAEGLAGLEALSLSPHDDAPALLDALLASPLPERLRRLELLNLSLDARAEELASRLTAVHTLRLRASATGSRGRAVLAFAQRAGAKLRSFELWDRDGIAGRERLYADAELAALLRAPMLAGLEELRLYGCSLYGASREALSALPCAPSLRVLGLDLAGMRERLEALAAAPFAGLRRLDGGMALLRDEDLEALDARAFDGLEVLLLRRGAVGPLGASRLLERFGSLRALSLCDNPVQDLGAEALAGCPNAATLRSLDLSNAGLTALGVQALCASPHLRSLRELNLAVNKPGARGTKALAEAPFAWMEKLDLSFASGVREELFASRWRSLRTHSGGALVLERRLELSGAPTEPPEGVARSKRKARAPEPPQSPREYDLRGVYRVGELLRHPELGTGTVRAVRAGVLTAHFPGKGLCELDLVPEGTRLYDAKETLALGEAVHHAKFGLGTVTEVHRERVVLAFVRAGTRTLLHAQGAPR